MFYPLNGTSIVRPDMIYAMSALRAAQQKINPILNVFVNEPIEEWMQAAASRVDSREENSSLPQIAAGHAQTKMKIVIKKLKGLCICIMESGTCMYNHIFCYI